MRVTLRRVSGGVAVLAAVTVAPGLVLGQSYVYPTRGRARSNSRRTRGNAMSGRPSNPA